jgi:hypothetical protein
MSVPLFTAAGRALYGPQWQSELARSLEVSDRTVRRWIKGDSEIPEGVWSDLRILCMERAQRLYQIAQKLDS